MAETLPNGTVIPQGADIINSNGVQAMRNLGSSVDSQLANRALLAHNHDSRYYTEAEVDAKLASIGGIGSEELGSRDLDTVTTPGTYSQSFSSSATEALNYPVGTAGRLFVQANGARSQVTQMYWTYDANANQRVYVRNFYQAWGEWKQVPLVGGDTDEDGSWEATEIGSTHLDEVTAPGVRWQSFSNLATEATGYPYPRAGHLIVTANGTGTQITQRYVTFDATANIRMSVRNFYQSWGEWRDIPLDGQDTGGGSDVFRGTIASGCLLYTSDAADERG